MTALRYWELDPPKAHEDDHLLKRAVKENHVPEGCLYNGAAVLGMVHAGITPCSTCECPRSLCGGPAGLEAHELTSITPDPERRHEMTQALFGGELENDDAADARRAERQLTIQSLNAIVQGPDPE